MKYLLQKTRPFSPVTFKTQNRTMSDNDFNDEFDEAEQNEGNWDDEQQSNDEQESDDEGYWLCECSTPNGLILYIVYLISQNLIII